MPIFNYEGRSNTGKKIKGSLKTDSLETVISFLAERKITPIKIDESKIYHNFPNFLTLNIKSRIKKKILLMQIQIMKKNI